VPTRVVGMEVMSMFDLSFLSGLTYSTEARLPASFTENAITFSPLTTASASGMTVVTSGGVVSFCTAVFTTVTFPALSVARKSTGTNPSSSVDISASSLNEPLFVIETAFHVAWLSKLISSVAIPLPSLTVPSMPSFF